MDFGSYSMTVNNRWLRAVFMPYCDHSERRLNEADFSNSVSLANIRMHVVQNQTMLLHLTSQIHWKLTVNFIIYQLESPATESIVSKKIYINCISPWDKRFSIGHYVSAKVSYTLDGSVLQLQKSNQYAICQVCRVYVQVNIFLNLKK